MHVGCDAFLHLNQTVVEEPSYLLERVFKQRLSGDGDLHMARESIGLSKDRKKHECI